MKETKIERRFGRLRQVGMFSALVALSIAGHTVYGFSGAGSGTPGDPYQIATPTHLDEVRLATAASYILVNNIDMTFDTTNPGGLFYNGGLGFVPITSFSGSLDGQGFTVTGLNIHHPFSFTGLIRTLTGSVSDMTFDAASVSTIFARAGVVAGRSFAGSVTDVTVLNPTVNVTTSQAVAGGLMGEAGTTTSIDNCHVIGGTVTASASVGGLVGHLNGGAVTVTDSSASATVSANGLGTGDGNGGLAGISDNASLVNCSASGDVSGRNRVGGLIGRVDASTHLFGCSASGDVTGIPTAFATGSFIGGLIGDATGTDIMVVCTKATGDVTGDFSSVAGLIGNVGLSTITIAQSYATGDVFAGVPGGVGTQAGGLIGVSRTSIPIEDCYARGDVVSTSTRIGGLIGYVRDPVQVNRCYATGGASSTLSDVGGLIGWANSGTAVSDSYAASGSVSGSARVGGLIGNAAGSTTAANSYFSNNRANCVGAGAAVCTSVADPNDFHDAANAPGSSWDTATVWRFCGLDDPCLQWDPDCVCPPTCDCAAIELDLLTQLCDLQAAGALNSAAEIREAAEALIASLVAAAGCDPLDTCEADLLQLLTDAGL